MLTLGKKETEKKTTGIFIVFGEETVLRIYDLEVGLSVTNSLFLP